MYWFRIAESKTTLESFLAMAATTTTTTTTILLPTGIGIVGSAISLKLKRPRASKSCDNSIAKETNLYMVQYFIQRENFAKRKWVELGKRRMKSLQTLLSLLFITIQFWAGTKLFQLEDAIEMKDFQEAARLKMAIVEATSKDSVAEIMSQTKNAVDEERYHDDLQLCRCTGSGLVGGWVVLTILMIPLQANTYNSWYVDETYTIKVVFLQQAKSLTNSTSSLSNSKPTQGPITSETEDASVVDINRNEVKTKKSEGKSINVEEGITSVINFLKDKIPGLKLKVMKINVIEEVIEDADALKQLMQEDSENTPGKDSDDETNNLVDGAVEDGKNLAMEVFIGGILRNIEDTSTKDECVRLPAEIKDMERDSFVLHVPARGQDRDTDESTVSKVKVASIASKGVSEFMPSDVAKAFWSADKLSPTMRLTLVSIDVCEIVKLAVSQAQKQGRLSECTSFSQITLSEGDLDPSVGLYVGAFGPYGTEVVQLRCKYGNWNCEDDTDKTLDVEFFEYVEAVKLTGDLNVPAGQVTFCAKIGRGNCFANRGLYPDELGVWSTMGSRERDFRGWRPVVRRHGRPGSWNTQVRAVTHIIFVDDIPDSMDPRRLHSLFSNFGVVRDVFIPFKRRKTTHTKFDFVKYDCPVAANMAVQKTDRLWCDDKALKVKLAEFGKEVIGKQRSAHPIYGRQFKSKSIAASVMQNGNKSYAQVVKEGGSSSKPTITIMATEEGNGWLYESVIIRLKSTCSAAEFKKELQIRGLGDAKFSLCGGRDVILSFNFVPLMKDSPKHLDGWIKEWSDSIKEWKQSMVLDQERLVWLSCYGVPPKLWSFNTFSCIGKFWGKVVELDDDTLHLNNLQCGEIRIATSCMESINCTVDLNCKGILYPVKICEKQIVISKVVMTKCNSHSQQRDRADLSSHREENVLSSNKEEEDLSIRMVSLQAVQRGDVVGGQKAVNLATREVGTAHVDVSRQSVNSQQSSSMVEETKTIMAVPNAGGARDVNVLEKMVGSMHGMSDGKRIVEGELLTPGYIRRGLGR
ncbi:unnamed protein product [Camellia sinensis]